MFFFSFIYFCKYCILLQFRKVDLLFAIGDLFIYFFRIKKNLNKNFLIFSVCASPSLVGAYYLHPRDARAIFSHSDLLCNGKCSVTGGPITYWGHKREKSKSLSTILAKIILNVVSVVNHLILNQWMSIWDFSGCLRSTLSG